LSKDLLIVARRKRESLYRKKNRHLEGIYRKEKLLLSSFSRKEHWKISKRTKSIINRTNNTSILFWATKIFKEMDLSIILVNTELRLRHENLLIWDLLWKKNMDLLLDGRLL
jgi:hypothetical protein